MAKNYPPSEAVLKKYADVLVNFALGGGKGIKKGDVVNIVGPEVSKPLFMAVRNAVLEAGGHTILQYNPNEEDRYNFGAEFFERANGQQLDFFPKKYFRGLVDQIDHTVFILGDTNPHALEKIDPKKIMRRGEAMKLYRQWRDKKERTGNYFWTIALWGTPAMAHEAGLSIDAYWEQIIKACFLDEKNPIAKWREIYRQMAGYLRKLNALSPRIEKLHVEGEDADLWITLGAQRRWLGGEGRNIPSFEIFTSPDWRGTDGWIRFNQPLYHYGTRASDIELWFKGGRVIKSSAKTGERMLKEMIRTPNADKIGEFSLTDKRFSRITKFMADTLFDENIGGPQGNTHIALGSAYADTFAGNVSKFTPKMMREYGFNDSSVHTDIISTTKRRVTAHLAGGKTKIIYDNGEFVL